MNKLASLIRIGIDDWRAERAIIAGNGFCTKIQCVTLRLNMTL